MKQVPQLNALLAFEVAARHLSFTKAAEELLITQGAISKQVNKLENQLGIKLFHRMTRAIQLTEHGTALWPKVREATQLLEVAMSNIKAAPVIAQTDACVGDHAVELAANTERLLSSRQSPPLNEVSEDYTRTNARG